MSPGRYLTLLFLFLILAGTIPVGGVRCAHAESLENLTYLTEEYFPFNYTDDGEVKGISADLLRLVWARLGIPEQSIRVMPWARAYDQALLQPGTVLFNMAKTPERDCLFRWAGPIMTVRFVLIAKRERNLSLAGLDDLKGFSIGTMREDIADTILAPHARNNTIQPVADMGQNLRKLVDDRLDMIAYEAFSWPRLATKHGLDPEDYESVLVLRETPIYYAFHLGTSPESVVKFQKALDEIKSTAAYQHILSRYMR